MPDSMIPFIDLKGQYKTLKEVINRHIQTVLDHGQYIMGPEVRELERRLASFIGAEYCITVSSGTEALLISLMMLGIKPGDEVITSPFTFISTVEVIVLLGGKPVFVDIESETCNMDVTQLEGAVTSRTRVIMPVSLYGQPCDMDEINALADKYGIAVIEDAAQSLGAEYKGRKSCNLSTIGCTSFFPSKPLGCYGDGGAIFTNDDSLSQLASEIRVHGQAKRYHHVRIGVGGRMDTLQCAVVLAKLDRFVWELERRIQIGDRYNELLDQADIPHVVVRNDRTSVYAQYTLFVNDRFRVREALKAAGIPTAVHYPLPIHKQPAYKSICGGNFPNAEHAAQRVISVPMHADLKPSIQEEIVSILVDYGS
jgi:UDP-2-acetamido-2-deoxy-ribo-hexuluronate aminotransferase